MNDQDVARASFITDTHQPIKRRELIDVAMGKTPAEIVVQGGRLVNVATAEIYPADVAIKGDRIAAVGDVAYTKGPNTRVIDATDGFDQDEAKSKRDERAVILGLLLASKRDTLEALELADRLFDSCSRLVQCFWKEGWHVFGVGSIRDCRAYSALAGDLAV